MPFWPLCVLLGSVKFLGVLSLPDDGRFRTKAALPASCQATKPDQPLPKDGARIGEGRRGSKDDICGNGADKET